MGASVYVGVLNKQTLRTVAYYRHSYSDTYYQGTDKTSENTALNHAGYNFVGIGLGYGLTRRLTIEADFGYFINKTQVYKTIDFTEKGYGFSNAGITLKYGTIVKPVQQFELTLGAGFKYPFTMTPQSIDGVQLNRDVQPSTNAFGASGSLFLNKGFSSVGMRLFSINRYDYNFEGNDGYKYGNILLNSLFVSKKLFTYCFAIVQVRSEWKTNDQDFNKEETKVTNSGFWLLTVSPSLSYSIAGKWNVTAVFDVPFYKDYNGKQLTPKYSFAINLSRDFFLGKKIHIE